MKLLNSNEELRKWAEQKPIIKTDEANILIENEYYDGPLNGVLLWNKNKYYFCDYNIQEETKNHSKRMFAIIDFTNEQKEGDESFLKILKNESKKILITQDQIKGRWSDMIN